MWNSKAMLVLMILCIPFMLPANGDLACNAPLLTGIDSITTSSFRIKWADFNPDVEGWEIEYGPRGFTQSFQSNTGLINTKSIKIVNLSPGTAYDIYIKTKCNESESNWNGPFLVRTAIKNIPDCNLILEIADNNCPRQEKFFIQENRYEGLKLGQDIFIQSIDLIIEHDWPADLQIELINPSGRSISLVANKGIGLDNFGNPLDSLCNQTCSFSDFACSNIEKNIGQSLVGTFLPEENIYELYDGREVNGLWSLSICDKAFEDKGILKKIFINFSELECNVPTEIAAINIGRSTAEIVWSPPEECEVSIIHIVNSGMDPGSGLEIFTPCQAKSFLVSGLMPETIYDVYIQSGCEENESAFSCPFTFVTACDSIALSSSFDNLLLCEASCLSPCTINDVVWKNVKDSDVQDWIIYDQSTPTDFTGPSSDISGTGNYIYHESSPELCGGFTTSILETNCLFINDNKGDCGMSFYYYMNGDDIGSLELMISNTFNRWDTLFQVIGSQKNEWVRQFIDLTTFKDSYATLRFVAKSSSGELSDIALDQIEFYKSDLIEDPPIFYYDFDMDNYGTEDSVVAFCLKDPPPNFVRINGDCDDNNININPGRTESGCNAIDDDCNGIIDDISVEGQIEISLLDLVHESCPGVSDGRLEIQISGGTPPYNIIWNNGRNGTIINGLADGIYYAEITDAGGCKLITPAFDIDIENSPNIFIRNIQNTACRQSIGSISIDVAGGTAPYTYLWNNGVETKDNLNLSEGFYAVQVKDKNGCQVSSDHIEVIATPRFTSGIQFKRDLKCFGDKNGMVSVGVINALEPVKYRWNNGDTTSTIRNLSAGVYSVTINDGRGCDDIVTVPILAPPKLSTDIVGIEQVSCADGSDGRIQVATSGGTTPYNFNWNSLNNIQIVEPNNEDVGSLSKGEYFLIVNDMNGCRDTSETVTITDPKPIDIEVVDINYAKCRFSKNGSIQVMATGGNEGFQYFWNNGDRGNRLDSAMSGIYSIRVIDQLGCKAGNNGLEIAIQNVPLILDYEILNKNTCSYDSNGIIAANLLSENKQPIDYNWSNGKQRVKKSSSDTIYGLSAGKYSLTATDNDGCIGGLSDILIPQVSEILIDSIIKTGNRCNNDTLGNIFLTVSGGSPPYNFLWNDGSSEANRRNLKSGKYVVEIIDSEDCSFISDSILVPSIFSLQVTADLTNASTDQDDGMISLTIVGGEPPYNISWDEINSSATEISHLRPGEYCVSISDNRGCTYSNCFEISNSTATNDTEHLGLTFYPNPAVETIHIDSKYAITQFKIFSIDGDLVDLQKDLKNKSRIDISNLSSGIYIIEIKTNSRTIIKKLVKI